MIPRGEVALIIAGIGLAAGILDKQLFGVVILMTLISTLGAPPLLSAALTIAGPGTRKPVKGDESASAVWKFFSPEIAVLVLDNLLKGLRAEGFYVQTMNINEGLSQARKDHTVLAIGAEENTLTIVTDKTDLPFAKTVVYEVILGLNEAIQKLKESADPRVMKQELADMEGTSREGALSLLRNGCIALRLTGETKEEIITEMVDLLAGQGRLEDRDLVLQDVFQREKTMSTGMQHGIALPHGKTDGAKDICVALGIKKEGVDFDSMDGEKSRLFIMTVSPRKTSGPHIQFLAAASAVLKDETVREEVINADSKEQVLALLTRGS
jgi:mannitol/fructose-specific phosphotransferase system IIA component (Ntr-type)